MYIEGIEDFRRRFRQPRIRRRSVRVVRKGQSGSQRAFRNPIAQRQARLRRMAKQDAASKQARFSALRRRTKQIGSDFSNRWARRWQSRKPKPDGPTINVTYSQPTPETIERQRMFNARIKRYSQLRAMGYDYNTTAQIMNEEFGFHTPLFSNVF